MTNAFEQFKVILISYIEGYNLDISLNNNVILIITIASFIIAIMYIISYTYNYFPNNWQWILESLYLFIFSIVAEQTGKKGFIYFPQLFTIFLLILLYNLIGLLPFSFTVSSQVIITFTIALSYFIAWIIIGIITLGKSFIYVFCPRNMPKWLLPLLICVEFLSFSLRPVSLGVRLFANMLAGHILLHILASAFIFLYKIFILLIIPAFFIVSAISLLELGISFLQAYIYTILLAIYLKDSLIAH